MTPKKILSSLKKECACVSSVVCLIRYFPTLGESNIVFLLQMLEGKVTFHFLLKTLIFSNIFSFWFIISRLRIYWFHARDLYFCPKSEQRSAPAKINTQKWETQRSIRQMRLHIATSTSQSENCNWSDFLWMNFCVYVCAYILMRSKKRNFMRSLFWRFQFQISNDAHTTLHTHTLAHTCIYTYI